MVNRNGTGERIALRENRLSAHDVRRIFKHCLSPLGLVYPCRCERQLQHRQKSIPDSLWPRDRGHRSSAQTACRLNYRAVADLSWFLDTVNLIALDIIDTSVRSVINVISVIFGGSRNVEVSIFSIVST